MHEKQTELPNIVIIIGPTAVGKTDISIEVAKKINGEIISADSAQVYKYMDIGTAKIKPSQMQGTKHYMLDEVYPDEDFSVAEFKSRCEIYIQEIINKGKIPIVVGGTGLYINSLLNNLDFTPAVGDEDYRKEMLVLAEKYGYEYVHEMLKNVDPIAYYKLHPNDIRRIIRALEVYKFTGKPISYFQEESKKIPPKYNYAYIGLNMDRQKLYNRINKRVDIMLKEGLIQEVEKLLGMGYSKDLVSMQALGYKEIIMYLEETYTKEEAIEILKRDSRRYAKRQLTWFRRDDRIFWIDIDKYDNRDIIIENIIRYIAGKVALI